MRGIKHALDPQGILNPGKFGKHYQVRYSRTLYDRQDPHYVNVDIDVLKQSALQLASGLPATTTTSEWFERAAALAPTAAPPPRT